MPCSCLNYFLNHKLFTAFFATTIHYKVLSNPSKYVQCICELNLKNMFVKRPIIWSPERLVTETRRRLADIPV